MLFVINEIFYLFFLFGSPYFSLSDVQFSECVLRDIQCNSSLKRPCCNSNDFCKQTEIGKVFRCTEKSLTEKLGKFCEVDEDCDGIRHSKCSSNECVCRPKNIEFNETACAPLLGGFCWNNEVCATKNAVCIENECQCDNKSSLITNKCIPNVLGAHCENDEICRYAKFATCSEKICVCLPNAISTDNIRCLSLINGFCWTDSDCSAISSTCVDNKCQCDQGMFVDSNKCTGAYLGMPCLKDHSCSEFIPHSRCSAYFTCVCDLYYFKYQGRCFHEFLTPCHNSYSCQMKKSVCIENVCQCGSGFTYRPYECAPIQLDGTCQTDYDCQHVENAICSTHKKCVCNKSCMRTNKNDCVPVLDGICHGNSDCLVPNSKCVNFKCQCKRYYLRQMANECVPSFLGMYCENSNDCRGIKNTKCSDDRKCECKNNYIEHNGTECAPVLGAHCTDNEICATINSVCLNNECQCGSDYFFSNDQCILPYIGMYCEDVDDCEKIPFANCIDHVCLCKGSYDVLNNRACAPRLGQYCQLGQQCAVLNSECKDDKCLCDTYSKQYHDKCVSKTGHFHISCQYNSDCSDIKYSECLNGKKCACKSNYIVFGENKCVVPIGEYCDSDEECFSYNTMCVNNKCQCTQKFFMRSQYLCEHKLLGTKCEIDHDCEVAIKNSKCSQDKICVCQENHYALNNFECIPFLFKHCSTDYDCRSNFTVCIGYQCQCKIHYQAVSASQCEPVDSLYRCDKVLDCGDPWHNECSVGGTCICKSNNTYINKSTCQPLLYGYCWTDHQCVVKNSKCVDYQCKCKDNYTPVSIDKCVSLSQ